VNDEDEFDPEAIDKELSAHLREHEYNTNSPRTSLETKWSL
jgi:hypothetical protein